jgi:hypothetical protein
MAHRGTQAECQRRCHVPGFRCLRHDRQVAIAMLLALQIYRTIQGNEATNFNRELIMRVQVWPDHWYAALSRCSLELNFCPVQSGDGQNIATKSSNVATRIAGNQGDIK